MTYEIRNDFAKNRMPAVFKRIVVSFLLIGWGGLLWSMPLLLGLLYVFILQNLNFPSRHGKLGVVEGLG